MGIFLGGTVAANELADYEEGTWTPTIFDASSGGNSDGGANDRIGTYTKIGNVVEARVYLINIITTGLTGSNLAYIGNFPFASSSSTGGNQGMIRVDKGTATGPTGLNLAASAVRATITQTPLDGSSSGNLTTGDLSNGASDMRFVFTYFTDA